MATVTRVYAVAYVATMLGEDTEMLEAIVSNDDNLSYGAIISVYTGADDTITALTDNGIEELRDMLADARRSPEHWRNFLEDFVADPDVIARVNEKDPRAVTHDRLALTGLLQKHQYITETDTPSTGARMPRAPAGRVGPSSLRPRAVGRHGAP